MAPPTTDTTDRRSERRTSISSIPESVHRLRRTRSNTSSMFSFVSQSGNKDEDRAVVYDPLERKLWVDRKENLQKSEEYTKVPIRGTELKVSVFMEMDPPENKARIAENKDKPRVFIATVDLGRLGKWVKGQRKKMRMQHLYVLGQAPAGFGPVIEEEGSD